LKIVLPKPVGTKVTLFILLAFNCFLKFGFIKWMFRIFMNDDDLEQVWKESIVVCFEVISYYFYIYTKNITETQSKH